MSWARGRFRLRARFSGEFASQPGKNKNQERETRFWIKEAASREETFTMDISKVRELGEAELQDETRKAAEQLFRIRFQMKLGQPEGAKRLRELRKEIAQLKTVERERALGIRGAGKKAS